MKKLLLATDDSEPAREAVSYLIDTYSPDEYSVLIASVALVPDVVKGYARAAGQETDLLGVQTDDLREEFAEKAQSIAQSTADRLRSAGFEVDTIAPMGDPGEELCGIAESEDVDEVVMGRRGKGRFMELMLGSVSNYVLHHAHCPVSIIPGPEMLSKE